MSSVASSWRRQTGACDPPRNAPTRLPVGRKTPRRPVSPVGRLVGCHKARRPASRSDPWTVCAVNDKSATRCADPSPGRTGVRGVNDKSRDKARRPVSRSDRRNRLGPKTRRADPSLGRTAGSRFSRTAEELLAFCPQRRADPSLGRTAGHCLSTPNDDVARQHVERARLKVHEPRQDRNALLVRRRRARETSELFCDLVEFVRESDPDDRRHEAQAHGKLATRALPEREVDRRPSGTRDLHGRRRVIEFGLHAPIVRR